MKVPLGFILSIVLHPVAMVLTWITIARRSDLGAVGKIVWGIISIIRGLGPIRYMVISGGGLW
jgi:hypothetical protein